MGNNSKKPKNLAPKSVLLSSKGAKAVAKEIASDEIRNVRSHRVNIWGVCSCGQTFHDDED